MMQQRIFIGVIFILASTACSTDFRSSKWGDTIEQVKKAEREQKWYQSGSPDGSQTAMYYEGQVDGLNAIIFFAFNHNGLLWGKHVFMENHSIHDDYYTDYVLVNKTLYKELGPTDTEYQFTDESTRNHPDQWGKAIYQGELLIQTKWDNERSVVMHAIFGKDKEITHVVEYQKAQSDN